MAPVIHALRATSWARVRVIALAQHRDLLDGALRFFGIEADVDLDVMRPGQTLTDLTGRMTLAVGQVLARERPDLVLAQGDTNSVLVTALCCHYLDVLFGHVEAGLRTGDRRHPFPEEMNRRLVTRLAELHFAPTDGARRNLLAEGVADSSIVLTGNTVVDALLWTAARVDPTAFAPPPGQRLVLATAHRRESFGEPLQQICAALRRIADRGDVRVLFPVHPNENVRAVTERLLRSHPAIDLVPPLDYPRFVAAMQAAHVIVTDSGGVQEEAPSLGKPVLVLRERTERMEGIEAGTARLVGVRADGIVAAVTQLLDDDRVYRQMTTGKNPYGDGHASRRVVDAIRALVHGADPRV